MLEKGKISASQLFMMMFLAVVASGVMWIPGITGKYAHNDLWLSPLLAAIPGFFTTFIVLRLHKMYPEMTVVQYSEEILGRFAGKAFSLLILFFYLHISGVTVRYYAEFIVTNFLHKTPISVVVITMLAVCALAVMGGVEVVGRTASLFFPVFIVPLLAIPPLLGDMEFHQLFPVLEHGLLPPIKGAFVPGGWFCEMFLLSFYLPYVRDQQKTVRTCMYGVAAIMFFFVVVNLFSLFVLGKQVGDFLFPVNAVFRYISVADFFENPESLVMAIWILGMFVKISVFYYAVVLGASQWLGVSDYRPLALPFGFLIGIFSFWSIPNIDVGIFFDIFTFPLYSPLIQTLLPLLLLLVGTWRKRRQTVKQNTAG